MKELDWKMLALGVAVCMIALLYVENRGLSDRIDGNRERYAAFLQRASSGTPLSKMILPDTVTLFQVQKDVYLACGLLPDPSGGIAQSAKRRRLETVSGTSSR